jgi:DNA-binding CsgD family transcriptional regulator
LRITTEQEDLFIGRGPELALAIVAIASAAKLIWIRGPAGTGKTVLLGRLAHACRERELPYHWLAPRVESPTSAVLSAIARDLGRGGPGQRVLLIDDFELLRSIEQWFVERFLPLLPPHVSVVVAARGPMPRLPAEERAAIDIELPELSEDDIERYLERRGVAADRRASIIAIAEGNPGLLGAALAAAERGHAPDASCCDCASLHVRHDTELHRLAVAVLVAARTTTYELLELAFEDAREAREAFGWLSRLAIVEQTPRGLRPHTLYRKSCECELARHAPEVWEYARRVVREFAGHRIAVASDPFHWVLDRLFVDRNLAPVREHVELPATDHGLTIDRARREDRAAILEVAAVTSSDVAAVTQWLDDEAAEIDVLRDARGAVRGCLYSRTFGAASPAPAGAPAIALASRHLRSIDWFGAATPPDASAIVFRCCRVAGPPLAAKLGNAMLLARMACRLLETPALEYLFVVAPLPERWRRLLRFLGVEAHAIGEVGLGEAKRTLLAADWRPFSIAAVLDRAAAASERAELAPLVEDAWPAPESTNLSAVIAQRIAERARVNGLSRREQEVLHLLVLGRSTAEIGVALHITPRTARFHQTNVLDKIGAESRLDVIRLLM